MEIRIVDDETGAACVEPDYVRVSARSNPEEDTVTLATIQRVVHKRADDEHTVPRIKTLLAERPMSPDAALELARSYAERKNIPLVLSDIRIASHR